MKKLSLFLFATLLLTGGLFTTFSYAPKNTVQANSKGKPSPTTTPSPTQSPTPTPAPSTTCEIVPSQYTVDAGVPITLTANCANTSNIASYKFYKGPGEGYETTTSNSVTATFYFGGLELAQVFAYDANGKELAYDYVYIQVVVYSD